jgi:uncharacterized tellurite resistance protein B-like protein
MSTQEIIYEKIKAVYQDAVVKKINKDNYLDIHLPSVNDKKGTHLFFNTSKGKIKLGFYCREDDFVENMLKKSAILEKYSQGIRLKGSMEYDAPEDAVIAAVSMISAMTGSTANTAVKEPEKAPELVDQPKEKDEERGFPMLRFRKPPDELKDVVNAYLKKWQKPSSFYNRRLGITAYIPEFVAELVSDDVCPVFTIEQINKICSKISAEKKIPILDYAAAELYNHTKQVWWIVPFCIWKDDTATMLFVDKDGFYSIYAQGDDEEIRMIFSWEAVHELEFEYAVGEDDDPNVCRLTLYQENGAYLTFDEFISEGPEGDHGSYLKVIEAIWEARQETIKASKGEPFWVEGAGGETFEEYGHPSELTHSASSTAKETIKASDLSLAHSIAFLYIACAGADGKVSEAEMKVLIEELNGWSKDGSLISSEHFELLFESWMSMSNDEEVTLVGDIAVNLKNKMDENQLRAVAKDLVKIANAEDGINSEQLGFLNMLIQTWELRIG